MVENAAARKLAGTRPFPPQRSGLPNMQLPGPPERRLRAGQKDRCVGVISGEQQVLQLLPSRPPSPPASPNPLLRPSLPRLPLSRRPCRGMKFLSLPFQLLSHRVLSISPPFPAPWLWIRCHRFDIHRLLYHYTPFRVSRHMVAFCVFSPPLVPLFSLFSTSESSSSIHRPAQWTKWYSHLIFTLFDGWRVSAGFFSPAERPLFECWLSCHILI